MVRRCKESTTEEEEIVPDSPPVKKHRRHGKRKHKQRRFEDFETDSSIDISLEDADTSDTMQQPKLTKIARDQPSTSAAQLLKQAQTMRGGKEKFVPAAPSGSSSPPRSGKRKKGRSRDSGTSSEEERWLDAIKSGKLEEVDDELKKIKPKDPKMMTARQRAMYERGTDKDGSMGEVLMALPSGYKQKVMTAEAIQKAAIKSQKRKQLADEKREKDKKKTMERLLKKQESKNLKSTQKLKIVKKQEPMIIYKNNVNEITLSLPVGMPFPLEQQGPIESPKPIICGVDGCFNIKKYNCSKTDIPLCSLACYKKNIDSIFT